MSEVLTLRKEGARLRKELNRALRREDAERERAELLEREKNALTDHVASLERKVELLLRPTDEVVLSHEPSKAVMRRAFERLLDHAEDRSFGPFFMLGMLHVVCQLPSELADRVQKALSAVADRERDAYFRDLSQAYGFGDDAPAPPPTSEKEPPQ